MRTLTLLLLSGGGHTGHNVVSVLAGRRASLRLVATSDVADEPNLFGFDAAYLAPNMAADPAGFERRFLEIVDRERPGLVIPCRDEDVVWLARLGARRSDLASRFLCGAPAIAEMANDKWLSHEYCRRRGLPFVPSLACAPGVDATLAVELFVREHGFPLVAKPREGGDSRGVYLVTTLAQALRVAARPDCVLQQYLGPRDVVDRYLADVEVQGVPLFHTLAGARRSLQMLIGPTGDVEGLFCSLHAHPTWNTRTLTPDDDPAARAIATRCAEVFAAQGWRGPMNVQCLPSVDGRLLIHEVNGRFTGATIARYLLGYDGVGAALRAFAGHRLDEIRDPDSAARVVRESLAPRAARPADLSRLAGEGMWERRAR